MFLHTEREHVQLDLTGTTFSEDVLELLEFAGQVSFGEACTVKEHVGTVVGIDIIILHVEFVSVDQIGEQFVELVQFMTTLEILVLGVQYEEMLGVELDHVTLIEEIHV